MAPKSANPVALAVIIACLTAAALPLMRRMTSLVRGQNVDDVNISSLNRRVRHDHAHCPGAPCHQAKGLALFCMEGLL